MADFMDNTDIPDAHPEYLVTLKTFMDMMFDYFIDLTQDIRAHLFIEVILLFLTAWLMLKIKRLYKRNRGPTNEDQERIIAAWKPLPLVEKELTEDEKLDLDFNPWNNLCGPLSLQFDTSDGEIYLNLLTHDYLNFTDEQDIAEEAERCIRKYGVGSCGPRGFYGTVDVHLEQEESVATFLGMEETALYSLNFSAIASAIPSYAKAGDIIFTDECVEFAIQKGIQASRSIVHYFQHNDVGDLERLLLEQEQRDLKDSVKAGTVRRFCVVEGIYQKTGSLCPLVEINDLCKRFKVRLMIDETISFGVLGKTGRGITEQLNIPIKDVDLISGSFEHSMASFGGFICGPSFVTDHQRISGLGYCFSASLPPFLAGCGNKALQILQENPDYIGQLHKNCILFHEILSDLGGYSIDGHPLSPVKFLYLRYPLESREAEKAALRQTVLVLKTRLIAVTVPTYLEREEIALPRAHIRICVKRLLTEEQMKYVHRCLEESVAYLPTDDESDSEEHSTADNQSNPLTKKDA